MSKAVQVVDILIASTGNAPIDVRSKIQLPVGLGFSDFTDDEAINKRALLGSGTGGIVIVGPKIDAGTPIPFFLDVTTLSGADRNFDVMAKATFYDPITGDATGQLMRYFDIIAVEQDTVGDGSGDFTGWNIYGHDDGSGNFKEDTYIILK